MRKAIITGLFTLLLLGCTRYSNDQKNLITEIISEPDRISETCLNSPLRLSKFFQELIERHDAIGAYSQYLKNYRGKYKIYNVLEGKNSEEGIRYMSIFTIDENNLYPVDFQFKEVSGEWRVYNIVLQNDVIE